MIPIPFLWFRRCWSESEATAATQCRTQSASVTAREENTKRKRYPIPRKGPNVIYLCFSIISQGTVFYENTMRSGEVPSNRHNAQQNRKSVISSQSVGSSNNEVHPLDPMAIENHFSNRTIHLHSFSPDDRRFIVQQ